MSTTNKSVIPPGADAPTRRGFHLAIMNALGALVGIAIAVPSLVYLLFPSRSRAASPWIDAGDIANLPDNTPVEMSFPRTHVDGWKLVTEKTTAWVVKKADGNVTAFAPLCTHLGCAYHWQDGKFVCPCH